MMKYLLFLSLALVPSIAFGAINDPIACYELDETSGTRADATTNGNDLSDNNSVLYNTGLISNGADFELSASEYLSIADASMTNGDIVGDMTISMWVKPESNPSASTMSLASQWGSGDGAFLMAYYESAGTYYLRLNIYPSATPSSNYPLDCALTGALSTVNFSHIVVSYDASDTQAEWWLNGTSLCVDTDVNATDINNSNAVLALGALGAGTAGYFYDGMQDVVVIYSNEKFQADVDSLYNSGSGVSCSTILAGTGGGTSTTTATTTATSTDPYSDDIVFMLNIIVFFLAFIWFGFIMSVVRHEY